MGVSDSARQVTECRVCGKSDWQEVVSFGPLPLANSYLDPADSYPGEPHFPLDVISCRSCRLMTLTHVVDPEVLYREYSYVTSNSATMQAHMQFVADLCRERWEMPAESFVVELGSNTGEQLMAFRDAGLRTLGVDPARSLAEEASKKGITTLPKFFDKETAQEIAREHGKARLILGRHVFAHIDNVAGIAEGVRDLLDPAGVFGIEVPYALDMLERTEFDTIYHEHLSYYAVGTLNALFERHGLRVVDVERLSVHGGSILVFVGHSDGPWKPRPVVSELTSLEVRSGLYEDETYQRFAAKTAEVKDALTALVRGLRAEGKRLAGYGAPAKGNTLLTVCGLGPDDLEYCCDTTPQKQGKVLPGSHIPVLSPQQARENPPDYYLLLAWNYTEEILNKEREFLEGGGRFIMPHPRPAIVASESL